MKSKTLNDLELFDFDIKELDPMDEQTENINDVFITLMEWWGKGDDILLSISDEKLEKMVGLKRKKIVDLITKLKRSEKLKKFF